MVTTEANQDAPATEQDGETQPAANAEQPGAQDGTEGKADDAPKTFTQSDLDAKVVQAGATKDQEIATLRRDKAEAALNEEIAKAREVEAGYLATDQRQVDEGALTADEAKRRSEQRQTDVVATIKEKHTRAAAAEAFNDELAIAQDLIRFNRAGTLGKKHGLTPEQVTTLEKDPEIKTEDHLTVRAERMALENERAQMKGTETFDTGQTGGRGPALDGLSPSQLTSLAYSDSEVQRRNRKRR